MANISVTAPVVTEVNNLLVALGKIDSQAEQALREGLRSTWRDHAFDAEKAADYATLVRTEIGTRTRGIAAEAPKASERITEIDVPSGRYAIDTSTHALNTTAFYIVKWWDGRNGRMVSVYLQVSDTETKLPFKQAQSVLTTVARDAKAASIRYGLEIGVCGRCGITLTNEESRAAGIGPICATKF